MLNTNRPSLRQPLGCFFGASARRPLLVARGARDAAVVVVRTAAGRHAVRGRPAEREELDRSSSGQNSQVARQNHLILANTPFTKRTSRRPALTAHPNPPRRPAVRRTKTARGRTHGLSFFGGSLAAAAASDRKRPQATAGDRRRPQATAGDRRRPQTTTGDRRRASASAATTKTARLHGAKAPPRLVPATWDFAHERAAEMGGGEWRPSHKAAQRSAGRMTGAIATSCFTPPGATVPM